MLAQRHGFSEKTIERLTQKISSEHPYNKLERPKRSTNITYKHTRRLSKRKR